MGTQPTLFLNASNQSHIKKCAQILKEEGIGAFPTETVYGLGADATNLRAVAKIFETKKRPVFDPLIVHVANVKQVEEICEDVPKEVKKLMERFWPGPLTFILNKKCCIPDLVTAGLPTIAVRSPQHPAAQKLLKSFGKPIAAPSANLFGLTSTTDAKAVKEELDEKIDFILDGGKSRVGIESTIIKVGKSQCELLRPGGLPLEELKKAMPKKRWTKAKSVKVQAPGQLDQHYATRTPLVLISGSTKTLIKKLEDLKEKFKKKKKAFPKIGYLGFKDLPEKGVFAHAAALSRKGNLREAANQLFSQMRYLDGARIKVIVAEKVPEKGLGVGINDRLKRASVEMDLVSILNKKLK